MATTVQIPAHHPPTTVRIPAGQKQSDGCDCCECCNCNPPLDERGNVPTCCGDCDPGCFRALIITFGIVGGILIVVGLVFIQYILGLILLLIGLGLAITSCSLCCCCVQPVLEQETIVTTAAPAPPAPVVVVQAVDPAVDIELGNIAKAPSAPSTTEEKA